MESKLPLLASSDNKLFPVFLKTEKLSVLVVGGGNVALEKLRAILSNAPATRVRIVAITISDEIKRIVATSEPHLSTIERAFCPEDAEGIDLAIVAIRDSSESSRIRTVLKQKGKLVNVADQPDLCDFYLGSIVQKGNLKIAISTNGKSPTIAKRLKDCLNEVLPEELNSLLTHMEEIRGQLKGDFTEKVKKLNAITRELALTGTAAEEKTDQ